MNQGLLWYDDSSRDLAEKIEQAAGRYRRKYGADATHCYVHPSVLEGKKMDEVNGIQVGALPSVLRHHFWLGIEKVRCSKKAIP